MGHSAVRTELVPKAAEASRKAAGAVNGAWLGPRGLLVLGCSLPRWILVDTTRSVRNPIECELPLKLAVHCLERGGTIKDVYRGGEWERRLSLWVLAKLGCRARERLGEVTLQRRRWSWGMVMCNAQSGLGKARKKPR